MLVEGRILVWGCPLVLRFSRTVRWLWKPFCRFMHRDNRIIILQRFVLRLLQLNDIISSRKDSSSDDPSSYRGFEFNAE